jgi:hypothetical protein
MILSEGHFLYLEHIQTMKDTKTSTNAQIKMIIAGLVINISSA